MRWSLILSAFIAVQGTLSFVCFALPVPPSSENLEKRARRVGPTVPSNVYRENAKHHVHAYEFTGLGNNGKMKETSKVEMKTLEEGHAYAHGDGLLKNQGKKLQADHVFEMQMFHKHLDDHKINYATLDPGFQKKLTDIMNGPGNMALIPGSVNQSKGQLIKHGLKGKEIKRNNVRDAYALKSYDTAHSTAAKLDAAFKEHGHDFGEMTFTHTLKKTFQDAGLHPRPSHPASANQHNPAASGSSSHGQDHSNSHPSVPGHSNPGSSSASTSQANPRKRPAEESSGGSSHKRVQLSPQASNPGPGHSHPGPSSSSNSRKRPAEESSGGSARGKRVHLNSEPSTSGTRSNPGSSSSIKATHGKLLHSNSKPAIPASIKPGRSSSSANATPRGKLVGYANSKTSIPGPPGRSNPASTAKPSSDKRLGNSNAKPSVPGIPGRSNPRRSASSAKATPRGKLLGQSNSKPSTAGTRSNTGPSSSSAKAKATPRGKPLGSLNSKPSLSGTLGRSKPGPSSLSTKATPHGKNLGHSNSKSSTPGTTGHSSSVKATPPGKLVGHSNSKPFTPGPPAHSRSSPTPPKQPAKASPRFSQVQQHPKKTGKK